MDRKLEIILYKDSIYMLSFYLMIISEIFNSNRFVAAIRFTIIPTVLALAISIVFSNWRDRRNSINDYVYLLFAGIITIVSVMTSTIVGWTANVTAYFIYLALFVFMTIRDLSLKEVKNTCKFYVFLCLLICSGIYVNYFLARGISFGRVSFMWLGVIKDQNIVSAFLVFGALLSFITYLYKRKLRNLLFYIYILFAMMLLGSRSGLMACMLSCAVMMIKWLSDRGSSLRKMVVTCFAFIFLTLVIVIFSGSDSFSRVLNLENYKSDGRTSLWVSAMQAFYNRPLIGSGYDSGTYYSAQYWNLGAPTHNSYIDLITSVGILGSVAYIGFVIRRWTVPKESRLFVVSVIISLLLPLFFINGYGTITFMMPCVIVTEIAAYCKHNSFLDIIL